MKPILCDALKPAEVDFTVAYSGGKLLLPDWEYPVVFNLETTTIHDNIPILLYHNGTKRVGNVTEAIVEPDKISLKGIIIRALPDAQTVLEVHNGGGVWECSVGTAPVEEKNFELVTSGTVEINQQQIEAPFYLLNNVEVREISFVSAGADSKTSVEIRASALTEKENNTMDDERFREFVASLGLNWDSLDEENREHLKEAFERKKEEAAKVDIEEAVEAACDNEEKVEAEMETTETVEEEKKVEASAMKSVTQRLAGIQTVNRPHVTNMRPREARVIEASMLMNGGASGQAIERAGYTQAEINEATSRQYRDIGLHGIMRRGIKASGLSISPDCSARELVRTYHEAIQASGLSTRDFSPTGIMSNVADKLLRIQADQIDTVADKVFYKRSVKTFNKVVSGKLTNIGTIPEVLNGEDFPNVGLVDDSQDYKITKKGVNLTITIEDQINDDLGAFERALSQFGRLFANSLDNAAIGALKSQSATIFTGNQKKTLAFSAANLKTVAGAFQRIKDAGGEYRNLIPGAILASPEVGIEARALFIFNDKASIAPQNSQEVMTTAYNVLTTPYLATTDGWYLLPRDEFIGEIAFLNGNAAPTVEQAALNTKNLNIEFLIWGTSGVLVYSDAPAVWSCPA